MTHRDIIVIGASAGGIQALIELCRGLPADLPAAVFVVVHTSPTSPGVLPTLLDKAGPFAAAHADDREPIRHGRVYVAVPDAHLLLGREHVQLSRGPKENGFRPAVDPLFRTAARSYGPRVIGVILSGGLDDGVEGLSFIKQNGGVAIVQDPEEAAFPGMPSAAIEKVTVDHVAKVAQIPALLSEISRQEIDSEEVKMVRQRSRRNGADPAEAGERAMKHHTYSGPPSPLTCPECGGALWELINGELVRYRCHVGHSYTASGLVANQNGALESALWAAVRALEETAELRRRMAARAAKGKFDAIVQRYQQQAGDAERRASTIRDVLLSMRNGEDTENATALASRLPNPTRHGKRRNGTRGGNGRAGGKTNARANGQPQARKGKKIRAAARRKTTSA